MYKSKIFVLGGIIILICLFSGILKNSLAYSYEIDNGILFYDDNKEMLQENIKKYLENIDDLLIVNSNFEMSDILIENYDFLSYFAFDYILNNYEYYRDKIIEQDSFDYVDRNYNQKITKQYIELEEIYKITDKYFGVKDYILVSDNVLVIDDYVSLIDYNDDQFILNIDKVEVDIQGDLIFAYTYYEGNFCYLYTFYNQNQVLKLKNIEVIS